MEYFKDNKTGGCVEFIRYELKNKTKMVIFKARNNNQEQSITEQEWLNGFVGNKKRFEKIDKPFENISHKPKSRGGMIYG